MQNEVFTNARIVTRDSIFNGTLTTAGTVVAEVDPGGTSAPAIDFDGDYLLPGLVELHTDNLEKHVTPRPGAVWPILPAVLAHDAQIAAAGITTVFDAIALGDVLPVSFRTENMAPMIDGVDEASKAGLLRAEHYLHLRCEVCFQDLPSLVDELVERPIVRFASVMDHTPGQRQFVSMDKYAEYYQVKFNLTDAQFRTFVQERRDDQSKYAAAHRRYIVSLFRRKGIPIASHDDAVAAHADEAAADGMVVAEFPTTIDAAQRSKLHGLGIMMGAPNLIRGGSHSGNVSAMDLARQDLVDIISSDYVPASLLPAAFKMAAEIEACTLAKAVQTVTLQPAERVGLTDRGEIAAGKLADLIRVRETKAGPAVVAVWKRGRRVL